MLGERADGLRPGVHAAGGQALRQLDSVRKKPQKFVCLNDNIDHRKKSALEVGAQCCRTAGPQDAWCGVVWCGVVT